jgi:hypothetical protein
MPDFQNEMNRLVSGFVTRISSLARQAAIESLERALGSQGGSKASRYRGEKRTSEQLEALAETFHVFVAHNPGLRIEQINKQLKTTTKDLMLPIRKLVADGSLKTKGTRRSTTYYASDRRRAKNAS